MLRILLTFVMAVSLVPALADEISVTEFVPGTIISSADMNQNFDTLVQESNENDGRITALENAETPVTNTGGSTAVWVDGTGEVLGYAIGYDNQIVYAMIPESNLIFGAAYSIRNPNPNQYYAGGVLYSLPGCKGEIALLIEPTGGSSVYRDGFRAVSFGVDVDGYYVYPVEPIERFEGNFYYQSRSRGDQNTGEISCENASDAVPAYLAATSSKRYFAPLTSPILPRRQ